MKKSVVALVAALAMVPFAAQAAGNPNKPPATPQPQPAPVSAPKCGAGDISGGSVLACSGWYEGNLLNNKSVQAQKDALNAMGFKWDGDWGLVDATKIQPTGGNTYDWSAALDGLSIIGIHKGKGGKDGVESTGFFLLSSNDLDKVTLNLNGGSSAVIYTNNQAKIGAFAANPAPAPLAAGLPLLLAGGVLVARRMRSKAAAA